MSHGAASEGPLNRPRFIERIADTAPSPEELLIARERLEEAGLDEEPDPGPSPARLRQKELLEIYLGQLSEQERQAVLLCVAGGQTQEQLAERAKITQAGVQYRIARAMKRLRWLAGAGSLFASEQVLELGGGPITREEAAALATYWRTTSHSAVQRERLYESHPRAWRVLHEAIPKLPQPFRKGFEALIAHGGLLLSGQETAPSALSVFLERRLRFGKGLTIAAVTLREAYDRFARSVGRPSVPEKLTEALRKRGARPSSVRVRWQSEQVRGWRGVAIVSTERTTAA